MAYSWRNGRITGARDAPQVTRIDRFITREVLAGRLQTMAEYADALEIQFRRSVLGSKLITCMSVLVLRTCVRAPLVRVFDLARSIDLHQVSTRQTGEVAVAGRTSGLIGLGESVTWRARHFGIVQRLTAKITAFDRPHTFTDEMVSGAFAGFTHRHDFAEADGWTTMTDYFSYRAPLGPLGRLAEWLVLDRYMTELLTIRNATIREVAESDAGWKPLLAVSG